MNIFRSQCIDAVNEAEVQNVPFTEGMYRYNYYNSTLRFVRRINAEGFRNY